MARKKRTRTKLTLSKVNKKLNNLIGSVEQKQVMQNYEKVSMTTTPTYYAFNIPNITQGPGELQERVGDKILLKKIQVKMQLQIGENLTTSLNDNYNQCRIILILYQTQQGVHPTMDDILNEQSTSGAPILVMNSLYKKSPKFKYRVLYDKVHNLYWRNSSGATGGAVSIKNINIVRKLNQEIHYDGAAVPAGWVPALLVASDSAAVQHPYLSYCSRITYTDI